MEPILSPWLTYKGDQRRGFINSDGTERIVGGYNPMRETITGWDGRLWVAHEGECETDDDGVIVKTRVRFRQVWGDGEVIEWKDDDRQ